jgi:hypothetical protein
MPLQSLTPPPPAPQRTDDADMFVAKADNFVAWHSTFVGEMTTLTAQLMATTALINVAPAYSDPGLAAMVGNTTAYGRSLVNTADAGAARATLGLAPFSQQSNGPNARIATNGVIGFTMRTDQTVLIAPGEVLGTGRLRVLSTAGIDGITTYGVVNYKAVQFIREEGGSPVERGSITVTDTGTSYNTVSDATMKDDKGLVTAAQARTILRAAQVHNYHWKGSGKADIGPFAQELFEVYPDAVSVGGWFDAEGQPASAAHTDAVYRPWGVDHAKLVPVLVVGWQDLDARLTALESAA